MKFIDLTTKYNITQDKIKVALSATCIIIISVIAIIGMKSLLSAEAAAEKQRRIDEAERLLENAVTMESTTEDTTLPEDLEGDKIVSELDDITPTSNEENTVAKDEDSDSDESEEATETTEATTTEATTTTGVSETPVYMTVYATQSLNLRTGPGTDYDLVRVLDAGEAIDVVAQTNNGWYKTFNGNYVYIDYTTSTPPATQPAVPTTTTTVTVTTTVVSTPDPTTAPVGSSVSCTITFYGPQPLGDGTYSTTTATGTTCSQGRTCAADWSIYPAGTVIYIENDPLGGDGYYTVEDKGPGVTGYHIDLYADDPYAYTTTTRNVSVA